MYTFASLALLYPLNMLSLQWATNASTFDAIRSDVTRKLLRRVEQFLLYGIRHVEYNSTQNRVFHVFSLYTRYVE